MSESGLVRRTNAGSYLYMKKLNRSGAGKILAQSQHNAAVTISVDVTEEEGHYDTGRFFSPIVIDGTNNRIDFVAVSGGPELHATVASGTYNDPHTLAYAIERALYAADPGAGSREYIVSWDSATYKFSIAHIEETTGVGDYLDLLWNTGVNGQAGLDTHIGTALGYADAADDTGATSYVSDNAVGTAVSWTAKPDIVVPPQGHVYADFPVGTILRFKADVGQVELTFYGVPGVEDPQPKGRFTE